MRNRLRLRVDELEGEVKALREEIENARKAAKSEEEVVNNHTYSLNKYLICKISARGCTAISTETFHPCRNGACVNGAKPVHRTLDGTSRSGKPRENFFFLRNNILHKLFQVRWTEMLRAQKAAGQQEETDKRQKQSVWKLLVFCPWFLSLTLTDAVFLENQFQQPFQHGQRTRTSTDYSTETISNCSVASVSRSKRENWTWTARPVRK